MTATTEARMNLATCTDEELRAEVIRREQQRLSEIGKDRYHPRRTMSEIANQLQRNRVHHKYQAVTICGAKLWLNYQEYADAEGGVVWGVMMEIDGDEYMRNYTEALCINTEIGKMISALHGSPGLQGTNR